jgi:GWxTD domain-containing protein
LFWCELSCYIACMRSRFFLCIVISVLTSGLLLSDGLTRGDQRVQKAMECLGAGDTLAAIDHFNHADLESIRDPQLFILHGRLLRSCGTIVDRLNSQYVLERAVQLFPDDPYVVQELGLTYFSQTFYPDAARAFLRAIEIDPGLCDAKHKLGVTHYERWKLRVNAYMDEAASARRWLKAAIECDPRNGDAATRYVYVLYALDRKDEAEKETRDNAARFPTMPEFPLLAGTIAYEKQQYAVADSCYRIALARMGDGEVEAYASLDRNLLGYDDMTVYEKASEDEQASIDHAFWVVRDFDPTTDINERFLEHVYRTFRADLYFSHSSVHVTWVKPQTRGWDTERGEISIKFGWPSDIHASHGGDRFESWTYVTFGQIHEFYFSDRFQNGKLQIPPNRSEKLVFARNQNQTTRYRPEATIVDGAMDAVVFKNDEFTSSVYVTMQINADSLLNSLDVENLQEFHARSRFFDEDWKVEHTTIDTIGVLDAAMISGSQHNLYDIVLHSQLPFSNYNLACAFEDNGRATIATFIGQCDAERFAGSDVRVSDLLYLRSVPGGTSIVRGGEVLPANPWRAYAPGQQLNVYFEIYNLDLSGGQSRYRLSFEIHDSPADPPSAWNRLGRAVSRFVGIDDGEPAVAQTFERVGENYDERERIAIDVGSLEEGRYRLIVTVTDLQNHEQDRSSKIFYKTSGVEYAR